jgi:hypothetical protein
MGGHTGERAHSGFCFHVTKLLRAPGVYPEQLCQHLLCRAGKIRVCQEVCDINWHQKITNIFVLQTHPGISTGDKVPELIVIATSARPWGCSWTRSALKGARGKKKSKIARAFSGEEWTPESQKDADKKANRQGHDWH